MGSNPVRALICFLQSTFTAIGKIAARLRRSMLLFLFYIGNSQEIIIFYKYTA